MSDIDDTIRTLTEQVEGLQYDLETCREANEAWKDALNNHDLDDVKNFLENHDITQVSEFLNRHDIEALQDFADNWDVEDVTRLLNINDVDDIREVMEIANDYDISDLKDAYEKIETYGEPEELSEQVERLEQKVAELEEAADNTPELDFVARADYEMEVGMRQTAQLRCEQLRDELDNVKGELAVTESNIVSLQSALSSSQAQLAEATSELHYQSTVSQNYAEYILELENRIDALQQDVALLSSDGDTYCSKYNALLEQHRSLTHSYSILSRCYFSQVSGDGWEL